MTALAVGVDVGGTKIAGALIDRSGSIVEETAVPTPRSSAGSDSGARATAGVVTALLGGAADRGATVVGIGIGVPEFVDPSGRRTSRLVLDWPDDLGTVLPALIDVTIESDVRCAARAEGVLGHGAGLESCLYVSLGTGISHTMLIDGRPWLGARGEAIALGELRVPETDRLVLDAPMTVEGQASGLALERVAALAGVPVLCDDPGLDRARDRAGSIVGAAIADLVAVLDPAIVVVGGGLGTSGGVFGDSLERQYLASTASRPAAPRLVTSALGRRAGRIGAGLVVHGR